MSSRLASDEYGANPTNATRRPPERRTVISPGSPVCATAGLVQRRDRLGAARGAVVERVVVGHVDEVEPEPVQRARRRRRRLEREAVATADPAALRQPPTDSVPSRLPSVRSASRSWGATGARARCRPPGGRPRCVLSAMSPTHSSVTGGGRWRALCRAAPSAWADSAAEQTAATAKNVASLRKPGVGLTTCPTSSSTGAPQK